MAALVVVVLLGVVGGLVLLNRDGGGGDVELTESQLRDALVTEGDIGAGFVANEDTSDDEDESDDFDRDEIDASEECLDLYEEYEAAAGGADASLEVDATFEAEDGARLEESLEQGSTFTLDDVRRLAETCPEITIDDGESVGAIRFDVLDDIAEPGDESLSLRVEIELEEPVAITVPTVGVLWERDGTVASVNLSGAIDEEAFEAAEPDQGLLRDVVERADEKLAEVISEA